MQSEESKRIELALGAPFDPSEVKFKPAVVSGNRALALPYVDARVIQDRLDEVLGVTGWQDDYQILADGSVICRLSICFDGNWIKKVDVGGPSEQPDSGDRLKAAFSDSLKRAAVKWGIGRYLYRSPSQWVDYDPAKKQFVRPPVLQKPQQAAVRPVKPTAEEVQKLVDRCRENNRSVEKLCDYFKVKTAYDLTPEQYRRAWKEASPKSDHAQASV